MRIAVIGYGGIGKAFIKLLEEKKEYLAREDINICVNYVINSSGGVYYSEGIDCKDLGEFTEVGGILSQYPKGGSREVNFDMLMEKKNVDLVIEMTPTNKQTGEPGITYIRKSLESGMHVITSNKGPVLLAYKKLNELAAQKGVQLCIGCTAGGALPSINGGLIDMAGSKILSIEGVLNGTTNFILDEMEQKGVEYKEALKGAQSLGIAEANPSLDVEGWDTAIKLLILTNVLMNEENSLSDVEVKGITALTPEDIRKAREEGSRYKLVGRTLNKGGRLEITVRPEKLCSDHQLFGVCGESKAVRYTSDTLGDLTIMGGASGVIPSAASVLRDLINIYRGYKFTRAKR